MIIIKLGGSLASSALLKNCLDKVENDYQGRAVIIVPGGGAFADQVRYAQQRWKFDDKTAHHMAILSMQQMALLLKALKPRFTIAATTAELSVLLKLQEFAIWSPDIVELDNAGVQSSWDITSDSLSAWLAKTLSANELILVKSVKIDSDLDVLKLVQQKIVDESFYKFTQHTSFKINIVHAEDFISEPRKNASKPN